MLNSDIPRQLLKAVYLDKMNSITPLCDTCKSELLRENNFSFIPKNETYVYGDILVICNYCADYMETNILTASEYIQGYNFNDVNCKNFRESNAVKFDKFYSENECIDKIIAGKNDVELRELFNKYSKEKSKCQDYCDAIFKKIVEENSEEESDEDVAYNNSVKKTVPRTLEELPKYNSKRSFYEKSKKSPENKK